MFQWIRSGWGTAHTLPVTVSPSLPPSLPRETLTIAPARSRCRFPVGNAGPSGFIIRVVLRITRPGPLSTKKAPCTALGGSIHTWSPGLPASNEARTTVIPFLNIATESTSGWITMPSSWP